MAVRGRPSRTSGSQASPPTTANRTVPLRMLRVETQYRRETRTLQREERDRYSNILWNMVRLDLGPSVTLTDLVGENQDADFGYDAERNLISSVDYYHGRRDHPELVRVLKFFCAYLMQQARKETDPTKQQFILFKTVDLARMIVQYSPFTVNADAEALVFGIFVDLGTHRQGQFNNYMHQQQVVYHLMQRLQALPNDLQLRYQLAEALAQQTCFIDAVVQYQTLLQFFPVRRDSPGRVHGLTYGNLGDIFQNLADHAKTGLRDARKLINFIDRFNRDFAGGSRQLPRLSGPQGRLEAVRRALLAEANRWYGRAIDIRALEPYRRLRYLAQAADNHIKLAEYAVALQLLREGYSLWQRLPVGHAVLEKQAAYLHLFNSAAINAKERSETAWVTRELTDVSGKIAAIEKAERERQQRKAALLG